MFPALCAWPEIEKVSPHLRIPMATYNNNYYMILLLRQTEFGCALCGFRRSWVQSPAGPDLFPEFILSVFFFPSG